MTDGLRKSRRYLLALAAGLAVAVAVFAAAPSQAQWWTGPIGSPFMGFGYGFPGFAYPGYGALGLGFPGLGPAPLTTTAGLATTGIAAPLGQTVGVPPAFGPGFGFTGSPFLGGAGFPGLGPGFGFTGSPFLGGAGFPGLGTGTAPFAAAATAATGALAPPTTPAVTPLGAPVNMYDNFFLPTEFTVPVGTTVTWMNRGRVVHTSTSAGTWDSGPVRPGGSWSAIFAVTGTFDYLCTIHPVEMRGRINVVAGPEGTGVRAAASPVPAATATPRTAAPTATAGPGVTTAPVATATPAAPAVPAAPAATPATPAPAPTPGAGGPAPTAAGATAAAANIAQQANSGVTGQATLSQAGATTTVTITLSGMAPNSAHAGHIHNGACSGPIIHPLATIRADSSGQGSATATVNAPIDPSGWWIQYHTSESPPGPPVACGQVTAGS